MGGAVMARHHSSNATDWNEESDIVNQFMQQLLNILKLGSVLWLFFSAANPARAQGNAALVRPDPLVLEVGQGQVEALNIVIDNAQDVYGIDVRAKFDPTIIEIADADPNQDGVQMIPGDFIKPDFLVRNTADNQKGTLQYVITQVNPTPPANGNGVVVSVLVRGKALGKRAQFTIDYVEIADRRGRKLAVRPQNGTVSVVTPKPSTPTPTLVATPTVVASETPLLALASAPVATPMPEDDGGSPRPTSELLGFSTFEIILILIALAGFLGAFMVVAIVAGIFFWRRSRERRAAERGYPQW